MDQLSILKIAIASLVMLIVTLGYLLLAPCARELGKGLKKLARFVNALLALLDLLSEIVLKLCEKAKQRIAQWFEPTKKNLIFES